MPGANLVDPPFEAVLTFSVEPESPESKRGINPGEELSIIFDLIPPDATVYDVLDELHSTDLRIGIHVRGFDGGSSESFVNVPEPLSALTMGLVGAVMAALGRKRRHAPVSGV